MKENFNVVYVIDENKEQLKMLCMSLDTLLKFNKVDNVYIMYYNIDEKSLQKKLSKYNVNIEYFFFDINLVDEYFPELPNTCNGRLRYPSLARWWITKVIPYDYFWYIDTDILFKDNIRESFLLYQRNKLFFAFNRKDYNWEEMTEYYHTNDLNAGILFINAKKFNELNLFDDIIKFYNKNANNILYVNQSGYSYLFEKYSDLCYIKPSKEINIKPLINGIEDIDNKYYNNVKIFHCNGENKEQFYNTYNKIMKI